MNTKTSLTILGVIAIIIVIFFVVKSKSSTKNETPSDTSNSINGDQTTNTPTTPGQIDPNNPVISPENPAFPTTGFEPQN